MDSLGEHVREYTIQLGKGHIQKAYKGIIAFMSDLRTDLGSKYPDYAASSLYLGYLDMTYFAFTPSVLKDRKLKIAIVYLHEEGKFELWLAANNRQIQADYIELLSHKNLSGYTLSQARPGVDSIVTALIVAQPDFDKPEELKQQIEAKTIEFAEDVAAMLE